MKKNITTSSKRAGNFVKSALVLLFSVVLLLASSCSDLMNPDTAGKPKGNNSSQNQNQDDIPVVEVTLSELKTKIQNYQAGSYTIYKVKGSMSNSEFSELQDLIENKSDNVWGREYVGLDLSEVTGLTRIDCTWGFKSLTIPSSVTEFGDYAQFDCVKILDGNPNFEYVDGVLYSADKTSLYFYPKEKTNKAFEIPSGVKRIQSAAFLWNNNIQSITIPESVMFIGMAALQTDSITQLTFKNKENWYNDENRLVSASDLENPASYSEGKVRGICRDGLFKSVTKTVTVAQLKTELNSFDGQTSVIYKVTGAMSNDDYSEINQFIREKGDNNWRNNIIRLDLSEVTGLTKITYVSWSIASVTVPKTFSGIGKDAEYSKIIVTADNPYFKYIDENLYSKDGTILYSYSSENTNESFVIPSSVTKIYYYAFVKNINIKSITIPESVVEIAQCAFDNSNIQTLTFKNKENWMTRYNNVVSMVNPEDLETVENYRWNDESQTNGFYQKGLFKPVTKTVTFSQLQTEINSFDGQTFTNYKVTGSMSNDDYIQINKLINDKGNNEKWIGSIINLDLSGVTGLTTINYVSWPIASVTLPKTFSGVEKNTDYLNIIVTADNPYFKYVDGNLYSADETVLYYYSSENTNKSFEIPSTVKTIWRFAFYNNTSIQNITIPESVVEIGWAAFDNDRSNIQTLTFKNKENWLIQNNKNNISKVNPADLEKVENFRKNSETQINGIFRPGLFKTEIKTVTVSQLKGEINSYNGEDFITYKVTGSMSNNKYEEINNLINQRGNNERWQSNQFELDLSEVEGLTKIDYNSGVIASLSVPDSVSEFGTSCNVNKIVVSDTNTNFKKEDGILYSKDKTILYAYSSEIEDSSFEIPSTVTKIWSYAFSSNYNITSISIPASVVYIGSWAFDNSNIKTLSFKNKENWMTLNNNNKANPDDLENVQNYRWNEATQTNGIFRGGLFKPVTKTVKVEQLINEINSYIPGDYTVFKVTGSMSNSEYHTIVDLINNIRRKWNWTNYIGLDLSEVEGLTKIAYSWCLFSLAIPNSVSELGDSDGVDNIIISSDNPNFKYVDEILYSEDGTILYLYPDSKTSTSFVIPSAVKKVWSEAFARNYNLRSITIPKSVVFIGSCAFDNSNIQTLTFSNKENWMGRDSHGDKIKINPEDLEEVENYRWNEATQTNGICRNGLFKPETKTVTVAELINEINSFDGVTYTIYKVSGSMSNDKYSEINQLINQKSNGENWNSNTIALDLSEVDGLTRISYINWAVSSVTIPDKVSEFGETSVYKVIVSDTNTNFKKEDGILYSEDGTILYSYPDSKTSTSFVIPSTVKKVWSYAFNKNSNITSITIPAGVVYIGGGAFDNSNIQTLTFKNKENWMARGDNNSTSKVNPDDLEKVENYRWNNQTQTNGIFRNGIFKFEIKTVTVEQLKTELNSFDGQTVTAYKVTGSMPNNDYNQINNLMNNKGNNGNWRGSTISLDLSSVTDLTEISEVSWIISSLTIPATVSKFGEYSEIYKVIVTSDNPNFTYVNGSLYSPNGTILYSYSSEKTDESFEIPATVTKIWGNAFSGNYNIKSITIPASVVYIGRNAFNNSNIQTLTFKNKENWMGRNNNDTVSMINPEDLEKVENYRWNQDTQTNGKCRNGLFKPEIKTVTVAQLPDEINSFDGVTYTIYKVSGSMSNDEYVEINRLINNTGNSKDWNNSCFGLDLSDVKDLTKLSYVSWPILNITIPNDVSEFSDDMCFTKIIIPSTNQNFTYEDGILYTADKTVLCLYPSDKTDTSFVIPASVTKICREAFCTNSYIQNITIPKTVVYICSDAFANQRIRTLTFRDKENWIAKTRNNGYSKINEADLENVINYRWDNNNQTSGLCENGLFKPVIKPVTVAQLPDEINSYAGGTYITYKVTGSMSNDEYGQISELIRQRGNSGSWGWSYIGLDLSEVTGLTKINAISWPIFSLTLPDSVSEFGEYVEVTDVMINSNNFVYEDGSLYSKDKTILYSYSSVKTDTSFEIPSGVKKVWSHAFYRNQSIRTVIIPESVIYIGQLALERNGINTITFKNKQNWMYKNNNNNNVSKVEPSELDVTQNFIGGKFRYGLIKPEIVTVAADELEATIGTYVPGTYIIYKVTGSMTNSECNEIIDSLATNTPGYIGLDLSEVSGLTSVIWAGMLLYIELPDSVQ